MKAKLRTLLAGRWAALAFCAAIAAVHTATVFKIQYPESLFLPLFTGALLLPGLLTMIFVPGQWRRWYRWAAIAGLAFSVFPDVVPVVLLVGETWALYRAWRIEREKPLTQLFSFKRPVDAATA